MLWAKLWTDVLADPKLIRAARKGARRLELLPWLLAFAKQADDGGRLTVNTEPAEPVDIAQMIPGMKPRDVSVCCVHLYELGILVRDEDDAYRFVNWRKRQGASPSDAPSSIALRVQKHRAKKRDGDGKLKRDVTPLQVVTRNGTEQEQEIEQEQEEEESASAAASGREQLLAALDHTRQTGLRALIAKWETGDGLPAKVAGKIPTAEQIDQACLDVLTSCELGSLTARTIRGFVAKAMQPEDSSGYRRGESPPPLRGPSPPVPDDGVKCRACGAKEMHEVNGRSVPKHTADCPIAAAFAQVGRTA